MVVRDGDLDSPWVQLEDSDVVQISVEEPTYEVNGKPDPAMYGGSVKYKGSKDVGPVDKCKNPLSAVSTPFPCPEDTGKWH